MVNPELFGCLLECVIHCKLPHLFLELVETLLAFLFVDGYDSELLLFGHWFCVALYHLPHFSLTAEVVWTIWKITNILLSFICVTALFFFVAICLKQIVIEHQFCYGCLEIRTRKGRGPGGR